MNKRLNKKTAEKTGKHFKENYGLKPPENYERYFVPSIGKPLAEDLISLANLVKGERVLDVACGTGIVARLAMHQVGETGTVSGLDINPGMLAVARSVSNNSIEWYNAGAENMPLADKAFDVVFCQLSLQFMEDRLAALQEMHRVLATGGRLFLNLPGPAGRLFEIFAEAMKEKVSSEAAEFVNHVFSLHSIPEIQELISDAGFREVDIQVAEQKFTLPPAEEFLWQYVNSTPLFGVLANFDKDTHKALEQGVVSKWRNFEEDNTMVYRQRIVTAGARK